MASTSKRAATTSVRYTFSDEEDLGETVQKNGGKKKKEIKLKTVVCKICHKKYTDRSGLLRHMEIHTDTRDFLCNICESSFKTSRYLARHVRMVHGPAKHECEFCGKRFTMPDRLEQHKLIHTGEKPHKCEICGKAFRAMYTLNTHRLVHTNEKPYKCQFCSYACRDNSTLRRHHERHTGTLKWHECSYCDKKFYAKSLLKNHVSERHFAADLKVIPCPHCSTKFRTQGRLNNHIKTVHEKAFRTKCEVCGLEISNKNNMASHLRVHLEVRPYKCKYKSCKSTFKDMSALKKHSLIHKPNEQFSCDVCGKLFARRNRLNVHMKVHGDDSKWNTKFKILFCDYCGFGFDNRPRLVRHMLKHIRHRNTYVCDICKFVTHRKLSIEKHMKYGHGDEDDVYCKICDKSYKLHAYLILHYYNRHGVRYKTVKTIKMETSVTIKEEPQEPIPDAEVDLEEIQKQEPLNDIITDVALDCDATDISYSKSVLNEDIRRSTTGSQFARSPNRFRKRLRGRVALLDEQNSWYANKERDVRKRIRKLLARVRQKKWTRVLERARQQYNEKIRAMARSKVDKENNLKIKLMNMNKTNDININKKEIESNDTKEFVVNQIDKDDETADDDNIENSEIVADRNVDRVRNDEGTDDTTSFTNDNEIIRDGDVRNIYEDVLDIEENPIGSNDVDNDEVINENIDKSVNDQDEYIANLNTKFNIEVNGNRIVSTKKNVTVIESEMTNVEEIHLNDGTATVSNDDNNTNLENTEINEDVINAVECETNEENSNNNDIDKDIIGSNDGNDSNVNNDKDGNSEAERGKNLKLKINTHQCYICFKLYETKAKLLDHCQEHFDICTDIPLKKCPLCNYVTKLNITRHIKVVHGINITLPYHHIEDKNKKSNDSSRYYYNINNKVVKEIEIIPSVKNLNKIAYVNIDKNNRKTKDLSVAKTKLIKKSGEWVVEHEKMNVSNEFILPEFDKKEVKRLNLKHFSDQYLDVMKALGRLAKRQKAKMLYPCDGCEKFCRTFAALKLHSRRHEANPKPFKKKVWKHKLKGNENKAIKTSRKRNKAALECVRQAKPRPIENKHKCDKELMDFYEKNVKGADIEFWQFLKIYNRMNKDHADNLKDLKETNEFGDYITEEASDIVPTQPEPSQNKVIIRNKAKVNVRNKFTRKLILSKEERLKREQIKEQLRRKMTNK